MVRQIRWRLQIELSPTETAAVFCFSTCSFWAESLPTFTSVEQTTCGCSREGVDFERKTHRRDLCESNAFTRVHKVEAQRARNHSGRDVSQDGHEPSTFQYYPRTESLRLRGFRIGMRALPLLNANSYTSGCDV